MKTKLFAFLLVAISASALISTSCRPDNSSETDATASNGKKTSVPRKAKVTPQVSSDSLSGPCIAYINVDSIQNQYQFNKDVKAILEKKQSQGEAAMKQKQQSFQSQMASLQQKYQDLQKRGQNATTQAEMDALNKEAKALQQQEANLAQLQERYQNEMASLETDYQNLVLKYTQEINDTIDNFLKIYSEENGYDFILGKGGVGGVLYGNPAYDVTDEVIERLNERYKQYKK